MFILTLSGCDMSVTGAGSANEASRGDGSGTVAVSDYPERVFWGDTHLHTDNSIDAFGFGVRLGPEAALRFARGEKVTATTGVPAQLDRPLDFLVIADHSDGLGAPRWVLFDALRYTLKLSPDAMKDAVAQERAYSSPIWLTAKKKPAPEA